MNDQNNNINSNNLVQNTIEPVVNSQPNNITQVTQPVVNSQVEPATNNLPSNDSNINAEAEEQRKNEKFKSTIYIIILLAVLIMFGSIIYSYYLRLKKENEINAIYEQVDLLVRYDYANLELSDLKPGFEKEYTFTLTNESTHEGKFKIMFSIQDALTDQIDQNFVYTLIGESNNSNDIVASRNETPVPIANKAVAEGVIQGGSVQKYRLILKVKNNGQNSNYLSGKTFKGDMKILDNNR